MPTPIVLNNGLRLLLDEMPGAASAAVNLCVLSGLRFEQPERAGISHMMEHMLFKGTECRTARQIAEESDDRGANLNAYTCKEYTCLYVRSLPEHLPAMLELLSDMLYHSKLAAADLETERGVVLEEIAMYEDLPEELVFDLFYDMVWPDHMLGKNILGTGETLSALTPKDLRAHIDRLFTPGRMVLSVCGKFDSGEVRQQIEGLFGQNTPGDESREATAPAQPAPTASFRPGILFTHKDVEQNQIVLAFPGCSGRDPKRYHASLLSTMLGGSSSSRLFQRLREELGLVYCVDFFNVHHMAEGISGVSLGLGEKTQRKALAEVLKILREFPDTVTPQELRRAQEQAAAGMVMGLESNAARASRAACNVLLYGDCTGVEESIAAYRNVTLDEMRDFARELLDPAKMALCVLGKYSKKAEKEMREMAGGAA
ncbi:MAG: insulinase family protein [Firmicutes bacterium]|nr:insulinase family protein [Bacillota bacterium]